MRFAICITESRGASSPLHTVATQASGTWGKDLLDEVDEGERKDSKEGWADCEGEQADREGERADRKGEWADRKDEQADCKGKREDGKANGQMAKANGQMAKANGQAAKAYEFQMVWPTGFHDEADQNIQFLLTQIGLTSSHDEENHEETVALEAGGLPLPWGLGFCMRAEESTRQTFEVGLLSCREVKMDHTILFEVEVQGKIAVRFQSHSFV
ncbi:hypothetical protein BS47DRAFT_1361108 [Hydnum rufescens UP504]|uniref:Uncharacterized protein n=1 Tax=Hydnum rufescens UP504 TaxID=1448309 RepID=A0A9P6B2N1_9AGAM|nr:hypothetical protein BS47DRAFT_1361108 [Hydnum rufescens UP504]